MTILIDSDDADLSELESAIARLKETDIPMGVQVEAKETLIIWKDRQQAAQ